LPAVHRARRVIGADGEVRLPQQWLGFAAWRHFWREGLRSTPVMLMAHQRNPADTSAAANRSTRSVHANVVWSPVAGTEVGVELVHGDRTIEDGQHGRVDRLQASAKYAF
jgi:hypothetical protein